MLGQALGNYRIVRRVGTGGMGTVYLAEHSLIGRKAAIKVLNDEYSNNKLIVQRFFNEAKAATAVNHPGIVEVYDFGYDDDGRAYIVMEYLEGESLKRRMRRLKWLAEGYVLNFARQMASALSSAHGAGIVHRDLKPDNLHVVVDPDIPGGERIKVLDFGIAKFNEEGTGPTIKTRTGIAMGTPAYMSPEQCKGHGRVDQRSDLYSIGVIMFEMVCGAPPFMAEGGGEVMAQHIYETAPSVHARGASVSDGTERIISKLLAKEPAHRFQNAKELMKAIDEIAVKVPRAVTQDSDPDADSDWALDSKDLTVALDGTPSGPMMDDGNPTTLSAAVGATSASQVNESVFLGRPRARLAAAAMAVAAVAGVGVWIASSGDEGDGQGNVAVPAETSASAVRDQRSASQPEPPPSQPSADQAEPTQPQKVATRAEPIVILIESEPSDASVYQMPASVRVGKTPYTYTGQPVSGELVFVLKRSGHVDETVVLAADESSARTVQFERRQRVTKTKSKSRARTKTAAKTKTKPKTKKTKTTKRTLDPFSKKKSKKSKSLNPFDK